MEVQSRTGTDDFVLVLEDDVWFKPGAPTSIDRGWRAALERCAAAGGPKLLYLSYADAGGTAVRADACDALFRPARGLWFLSGYVLSREGGGGAPSRNAGRWTRRPLDELPL